MDGGGGSGQIRWVWGWSGVGWWSVAASGGLRNGFAEWVRQSVGFVEVVGLMNGFIGVVGLSEWV